MGNELDDRAAVGMRFSINQVMKMLRPGAASSGRRFRAIILSCVTMLLFIAPACEKKNAIVLPPPTVEVMSVKRQDVPIYREWIGTLDGYVNADVRAQVSGYLLSQDYKEGTLVKKGDVLFKIDPRLIEASLEQANGQLAQAQAQLGRTEIEVKRDTPLAKAGAISQQELDNAVQANLGAKADVDAAQAAVNKAQIDLGFTKIVAPVDGIAGLANAQVGDLVGPSSAPLTTVSTVNPIKVLFTISEQDYLKYLARLPDVESRSQYRQDLQMELIFPDGSTYPQPGKFYAAQRQVDSKTGTLQIAGEFPNPLNVLKPGQFVRVRVRTNVHKNALLVPQRAVIELQSVYQVAVVTPSNTVEMRSVKVGDRYGAMWIVTDGLNDGDRVVVEGVQKVREGLQVNVEAYSPATQPATAPSQSHSGD
jgi:membrane fusion protein (multidrug efflux system)